MFLYESVCMVLFSLCFMMLINSSLPGMEQKPSWYYGAAGDVKKISSSVLSFEKKKKKLLFELEESNSKVKDSYMILHSLLCSKYNDNKKMRHQFIKFLQSRQDITNTRIAEMQTALVDKDLNGLVEKWFHEDRHVCRKINITIQKEKNPANKIGVAKKKVHPNTLLARQAIKKTLSDGV